MLVDELTGEEKWAVQAHSGEGIPWHHTKIAISGRFVASVGFDDRRWKLWDVARGSLHKEGATHDGTGACTYVVQQEGRPVVAHTGGFSPSVVAFSPCGQRLATGGAGGAVVVWDAGTGKANHRMQGDAGFVCSLDFSADGARLACGSVDGLIRVWDVPTGALLRTMKGGGSYSVATVQFSPTNQEKLVSGGSEIQVWDVDSGEKIKYIVGRRFAFFSPDGRTLATASAAGDVQLIDVNSGEFRLGGIGHERSVSCGCFSGDGGKLASGSSDGTCKVWDSSTGALLRTINVGRPVESVAWGRDWVRDTQRGGAFAMGQHPRLGARSQVLELEAGVVQMILDQSV